MSAPRSIVAHNNRQERYKSFSVAVAPDLCESVIQDIGVAKVSESGGWGGRRAYGYRRGNDVRLIIGDSRKRKEGEQGATGVEKREPVRR